MSAPNNPIPNHKASLELFSDLCQDTRKHAPIAFFKMMEWAKEACESTRAFYDARDSDFSPPSWLPELEAALQDCKAVAAGTITFGEVINWTLNGGLPDSDMTVLVATDDGEVREGFYDSECAQWRWGDATLVNSKVTGWADLPAGPCF